MEGKGAFKVDVGLTPEGRWEVRNLRGAHNHLGDTLIGQREWKGVLEEERVSVRGTSAGATAWDQAIRRQRSVLGVNIMPTRSQLGTALSSTEPLPQDLYTPSPATSSASTSSQGTSGSPSSSMASSSMASSSNSSSSFLSLSPTQAAPSAGPSSGPAAAPAPTPTPSSLLSSGLDTSSLPAPPPFYTIPPEWLSQGTESSAHSPAPAVQKFSAEEVAALMAEVQRALQEAKRGGDGGRG